MLERIHMNPTLGTTRALAGQPADEPRLQNALREFESLFMHELLKTMRSADSFLHADEDDGESGNLMNELLDEKLAGVLVRGGGLGLTRLLEAQLAARSAAGEGAASKTPNEVRE